VWRACAGMRRYALARHRKDSRGVWAVVDGSFCIVLAWAVGVLACAFALGTGGGWRGALRAVAIAEATFLLGGACVATGTWALANRFLRLPAMPQTVSQKVSWTFAFDVYLTACVPGLAVGGVLAYAILPLLLWNGIVGLFLGNTVFFLAWGVFCFFQFRGFALLPFLGPNTRVFLAPCLACVALWALAILLRWNVPKSVIALLTGHTIM
jgi:UNC-50 family